MFYLSEIDHILRLPPHLLNLSLNEAMKGVVEGLFLDKVHGPTIFPFNLSSICLNFYFYFFNNWKLDNPLIVNFFLISKVISNLGLCVSVYDIQSIDGGFIFPSDGASTYTVKFRLIMFRPFVGEVIAAKLKESTANGLRLSLGFFDDIYVPAHLMPTPSRFVPDPEHKNQVKWIWDYGESADQNEPADDTEPAYTVERHDEIRFRVQNVMYPSIPIEKQEESKLFSPMVVTGSLDADGLGPVEWWRGS